MKKKKQSKIVLLLFSIFAITACNSNKLYKPQKAKTPVYIIDIPVNEISGVALYDEEVFNENFNALYINPDSIYGCSNYGNGDGFEGKLTANGEKYNHYAMDIVDGDTIFTCASFNLPFNTVLKVTNVKNNRSVLVRVNDGGPYACHPGTTQAIFPLRAYKGRKLDINTAAAQQLGCIKEGIATIKIDVVKYPSVEATWWMHLTDIERRRYGWKSNNMRFETKINKAFNNYVGS